MTDNVYILLNARIFTPLNNDNLHTLRRPSNSIHLVVTTSFSLQLSEKSIGHDPDVDEDR